ncbi:Hypothetical protein ETEE_3245 [Edwardsiella anguillarum ET080813]|uniref:Uncharacterized protein n=1 Tax=Edwardsiella anguillarum ET080813 TaxID=667120 RepID=A0A076LME0_9GAMM|nr:Hypothetical protein ETEE_3245 [Edwardsiella anguillarum ET080813]
MLQNSPPFGLGDGQQDSDYPFSHFSICADPVIDEQNAP